MYAADAFGADNAKLLWAMGRTYRKIKPYKGIERELRRVLLPMKPVALLVENERKTCVDNFLHEQNLVFELCYQFALIGDKDQTPRWYLYRVGNDNASIINDMRK